MDHEPLPPEKKKRGCPKGSKDKPRQPGDKPRGRPRKAPETAAQVVSDRADVDGKLDSLVNFSSKYYFWHFLLLDNELADNEYAGLLDDDDFHKRNAAGLI